MNDEHRLVCEQSVAAGLDEVWALIATSDGRAAWFGTSARIDLVLGGASHVDWGTEEGIDGVVRAVEPGRRLRIAYELEGRELGAEEYLLNHDDGVTHVRVIQSFGRHGSPDADGWDGWFGDLERGWRLFLRSLEFAATEAVHPHRLATSRYVRLGAVSRPVVWDRLLLTLGLSQRPEVAGTVTVIGSGPTSPVWLDSASVLLSDAPHSLLIATTTRTVLVDLEGSTDDLVAFAQTADHDLHEHQAWQTDLLERIAKGVVA